MGGDGDTREVCLLDWLVGVLEEHRDPAALAHCVQHTGGATHDPAYGILVRLPEVTGLGDVDVDAHLTSLTRYLWSSTLIHLISGTNRVSMGLSSALLSKGISMISRGGPRLRRWTSFHCSGVCRRLRVS